MSSGKLLQHTHLTPTNHNQPSTSQGSRVRGFFTCCCIQTDILPSCGREVIHSTHAQTVSKRLQTKKGRGWYLACLGTCRKLVDYAVYTNRNKLVHLIHKMIEEAPLLGMESKLIIFSLILGVASNFERKTLR